MRTSAPCVPTSPSFRAPRQGSPSREAGLILWRGAAPPPAPRGEFAGGQPLAARVPPVRPHRALMWRALGATALLMALFFAGQPPAKAAIVIGGLLLLTRRVRSERVYAQIDWSLLLMFAGLFIIVAGAEHALLSDGAITAVARLHLDRVPVLSAVTAVLSNLVSNVPAVLVLKAFIDPLSDQH